VIKTPPVVVVGFSHEPFTLGAVTLATLNRAALRYSPTAFNEAVVDQHANDKAAVNAAALEDLIISVAQLDLTRTSRKIAWQVIQIALMASQANVGFQSEDHIDFVLRRNERAWRLAWDLAWYLSGDTIHRFAASSQRHVSAPHSNTRVDGRRVAASAAIFLNVGAYVKSYLEWIPPTQLCMFAVLH
jgi:hypothetical protein